MQIRLVLVLLFAGWSSLFGQWMPPNSPTVSFEWKSGGDLCDYMFLGLIGSFSPSPARPTHLILDRRGDIVWYQQTAFQSLDFKVQASGMLSFFYQGSWYVLDSTFSVVDTLSCSGYTTDLHDLLLTEDGHAFLICSEDTTMDLSSLHTRDGQPGDPNGLMKSHLVQELDAQRNVVREWHARDHFDLSDHDTTFFTDPTVLQLNHTNAIFLHENNRKMLVSHRYNHELTYIDWPSGSILWRLGGANNQFSFTNDMGLSAQHFGQILPDGKVSVFDNGNYHNPSRARGIVYDLDTANMTATKTWEYANPNLFSTSYGSFQVLPNGDRLVNFGAYVPHVDPNVVYLRADSTVVLEMKFEDLYWTYRAQCLDLPFQIDRPEIVCTAQGGQITLSADTSYAAYLWTTDATTPSITVLDTGDYQVFVPLGLGMVGSEVYHVADLNAPCAAVHATEPSMVGGRPAKLVQVYDLLGRPVEERKVGELYFELYSDGKVRKTVQGKQ